MARKKSTTKKPRVRDFLTVAKNVVGREKIELPDMGVTVYARPLNATEMRLLTNGCLLPGKKPTDGDGAFDNEKILLRVIAASIVDENGERLIPDGREAELRDLPNAIYVALQAAAVKANGIGAAPGN